MCTRPFPAMRSDDVGRTFPLSRIRSAESTFHHEERTAGFEAFRAVKRPPLFGGIKVDPACSLLVSPLRGRA